MHTEEKYFLLIGGLIAAVIGYFIAQHNHTRGYSFGRSFFYAFIGMAGLVIAFWQYWYKN